MKKIFYIFALFNLILLNCYAQPSITWSKTYGKPFLLDLSYTICNTGSGYYYVGGYEISSGGYLLKINEYGDTTWSKFIPQILFINTIITLQDKGCIIAGDSDSLTIMRLDSNSNIIWSKDYQQNFNIIRIKDIKKTLDEKYIACGYRFHEDDGILLKFDEDGNLYWKKIYPASFVKTFLSIEITPDNGYITTGTVIDYDTSKTLLLRFDSTGGIIWEKQYKISNQPAYGNYIKKINSGYIIAGGTYDTLNTLENRVYFMRVDTAGNLKYEKVIPYFKYDEFYASLYLNENKFIFSSFTSGPGSFDTASYSRVIITDSLGNILVSRNFYGDYYYGYNAITKANNSDIILAGSAKIPGSGEDILVCRVDSLLQGPPIGIKKNVSDVPSVFVLYQNFPNPFNPSTIINYELPIAGYVKLSVYDILGRELTVLVNEKQSAGKYSIEWNAGNYPSGVYFYTLQTNKFSDTRKMILLK